MTRARLADQPIDVVELDGAHLTVTVAPTFAPTITLHVVKPCGARTWLVARDEGGYRVVAGHRTQERAVRTAISRARRYAAAYSVNRQTVGNRA